MSLPTDIIFRVVLLFGFFIAVDQGDLLGVNDSSKRMEAVISIASPANYLFII